MKIFLWLLVGLGSMALTSVLSHFGLLPKEATNNLSTWADWMLALLYILPAGLCIASFLEDEADDDRSMVKALIKLKKESKWKFRLGSPSH